MPKHFMEIPLWIAIISGMMPDEQYDKNLFIVDNIESAKIFLNSEKDEILFFSVMDVNLRFVKDLVNTLSHKRSIIGGYVNRNNFFDNRNVTFLEAPEELSRFFMINEKSAPDYRLFQGEKCIPRLALSSGCLFSCSFCTVPRILSLRNENQILAEVESFFPLEFKVVYLDDKTFVKQKTIDF